METLSDALLTPAQAARALALSESSVRRLCDSGVLESVRTEGGHRRIRPSALSAYARGTQRSLTAAQARAAAGRGGRRASEPHLVERASAALVAGDAALVRRILGELSLAGESAAYIADRVIAPAMVAIGQRWAAGELAVYQEHRASEIVLAAAAQAALAWPASSRARRAVCAAPEGDPSSIAAGLAAWMLSEVGYRASTLGANMPYDGLERAVRELRPHLLVLSVGHVSEPRACIARCRSLYALARRMDCAVALGGRGLTPRLRAHMSADFLGDTLTQLREYATKRTGSRSR